MSQWRAWSPGQRRDPNHDRLPSLKARVSPGPCSRGLSGPCNTRRPLPRFQYYTLQGCPGIPAQQIAALETSAFRPGRKARSLGPPSRALLRLECTSRGQWAVILCCDEMNLRQNKNPSMSIGPFGHVLVDKGFCMKMSLRSRLLTP